MHNPKGPFVSFEKLYAKGDLDSSEASLTIQVLENGHTGTTLSYGSSSSCRFRRTVVIKQREDLQHKT